MRIQQGSAFEEWNPECGINIHEDVNPTLATFDATNAEVYWGKKNTFQITWNSRQGNYSNSHVRSCQNENKNKAKQNNIMSRTSTLICDFTDELQSVQSKALFNFFCHWIPTRIVNSTPLELKERSSFSCKITIFIGKNEFWKT